MPNWVDNILTFDADEQTAMKIRDKILDEKGEVTFQKLIPRPKSLDITNHSSWVCSTDFDGFNVEKSFEGLRPKDAKLVKLGAAFVIKYYKQYILNKNAEIQKHNQQIVEKEIDMKGLALMYENKTDGLDAEFEEFLQAIDNKIRFGFSTWYGWNIKNWGCKWDASETYVQELKLYQFNTPWSPPGPWLEALSNKFPEVTFSLEWHDEDPSNNGLYVLKAGEILEAKTWAEAYDEDQEEDLGPDPATEELPATGDNPANDETF